MPQAIGAVLVAATAPELAAAAAAPLSFGGVSFGVSATTVIGSATILDKNVNLINALKSESVS